ncbi:MAG: PAS domain S-box protein [Coleofasciculus sp. G3-WIS-01]|uniref:PAS domain S-box protein n=1 Tax=Coleofasciculus sp. G3-WIS-01 TaxID=3069528 RepID=UPI0033029892
MAILPNSLESTPNSTKDQQTPESLQQSEARFQTLVANIPGAVYRCTWDSVGTMTFLSSAIQPISGYEASEFIHNRVRSFHSIIHPQDRRRVEESVWQSIDSQHPYTIEYRIVRADGKITWVYDQGQGILDENGVVQWLDGVILDITERKQTEIQLRETQAFLNSVVENLPVGVFIKDAKDLQVMYWNKTSEELLGYSKAQVLGKNDYDFLPYEQARLLRAKDRQILTDGKLVDIPEASLNTPHRGERIVNTKKVPLLDEKGTPQYILGIVEDITERKQAEAALQESERHYRCIVETASEGVWVFDANNQITFANSRMAQMLGYPIEQMLGRSLFDFIDTESEALIQTYLERRRQGIQERYDFKFRRQDGSDLWAIISATPLFNDQGSFVGVLRMITDISDRKQAEEALQEREQFLRSILNGVENSISVVDVHQRQSQPNPSWQFRYVDVNPAYEHLIGIPGEQLRDQPLDAILPPDLAVTISERYNTCVQTGTSISYEECFGVQGQESWWITTLTPLRDRLGHIYRVVSTSTNITQRKQAEQKTARLTAILESTTDFVSICEPDGTFLYINKAGRQMVGLDPEQQISHLQIWDFHPQSVKQHLLEEGLPKAIQDKVWQGETSLLHQQGWEIPVSQVVMAHQGATGEVEVFSTIIRDISDRKQAEEALRKSEHQLRVKNHDLQQTLHQLKQTQTQLIQQEKMVSLGQMVAGISHEINNPISFIAGNITYTRQYGTELLHLLQLYAKNYPEPVAEIQAEIEAIDLDFVRADFPKLLNSMQEGANRIRQIVLSLRNFSRLDEAEIKSVDIHDGIESTLLILQHRLKSTLNRPEIQVHKQYAHLPLVECYASQLNQVFLNILGNAIDALHSQTEPGRITISTQMSSQFPVVPLEESPENKSQQPQSIERVIIRIQDNGPGIPEAIQNQIFNPFFTTKPIGTGTGLGLSISHSIVVDKHGGQLTCISQPGQGTEFIIELPVKQKSLSSGLKFSFGESFPLSPKVVQSSA